MLNRVIPLVLVLLVATLIWMVSIEAGHGPKVDYVRNGSTGNFIVSKVVDNVTLAQTMRQISESVDWNKAFYAGVIFNEKTVADLEAMIDNFSASGDWLNVLSWTAICRKLGIEREDAVKAALDGLPMIGPLPYTATYMGTSYFCVEHKFALLGYHYAEKYGYRQDKWNKTCAYQFFKSAVHNFTKPVLFIDAAGNTWTIGYGPRYYDESACTIQCLLVFYELGISDALEDALYWWNWVNNNLWYQNTHYKYGLSWADFECEAGFFAEIVANLRYFQPDLGNWSRVLTDLENRFLIERWKSKQWLSGRDGSTAYVAVHHYPSNPQRRLKSTIGAWTAMLSLYLELPSSPQEAMQDLLEGYDQLDPAWSLLLNPVTDLYDATTHKFRWTNNTSFSDDATAYGLTLMFLMGIVPKTAALAFPLEDYGYEHIQDIDPDLYRIDLYNNRLRVSVVGGGQLDFIYGTSVTACVFPSNGVYEIRFSEDWNSVTDVSRICELPSNRKFAWSNLRHDVAIGGMQAHGFSFEVNETVDIKLKAFNEGDCMQTFNLNIECTYPYPALIATRLVSLNSGESKVFIFSWTPLTSGRQELRACTSDIPDDQNSENNIEHLSVCIYEIPSKPLIGPFWQWSGIEYWILRSGCCASRIIANY